MYSLVTYTETVLFLYTFKIYKVNYWIFDIVYISKLSDFWFVLHFRFKLSDSVTLLLINYTENFELYVNCIPFCEAKLSEKSYTTWIWQSDFRFNLYIKYTKEIRKVYIFSHWAHQSCFIPIINQIKYIIFFYRK